MSRAADESCIDRSRASRILQTSAVANGARVLGALDEQTIAFFKQLGKDLLEADDAGRIWLEKTVVREQAREMMLLAPTVQPPVVKEVAILLRCMLTEASKRGGSQDFAIISLYRAGDAKGPHLERRAIDLMRYAGKRLDSSFPDEAADGVTACYRDIAAHSSEVKFRYAFGLPRNLRTDNVGIEAELRGHKRKEHARIYDKALSQAKQTSYSVELLKKSGAEAQKVYDEIRAAYKFTDVFFPHSKPPGTSPTGSAASDIGSFVRQSLHKEWTDILKAGGSGLHYLFPDELDHLHIQVT